MPKQSQICLWQKKLLQKSNNFKIFGKTPLGRGFVFVPKKNTKSVTILFHLLRRSRIFILFNSLSYSGKTV